MRSGNTKSCGCGRAIGLQQYNQQQSDLNKIEIGTRFGKLVVLEDIGMRPHVEGHNRRWYRCQCDCGNEKEVMGNSLKTNHIVSCGQCNMSSSGEYQIAKLLDDNGIFYQHDCLFTDLYRETGRKLRFDFILYEDDLITPKRFIEFDGRQHMTGPEAIWSHSDSLETIQERDSIKNNFCLSHNYPLIRIPYTKLNHITIEDLLGNQYLVKGGDYGDND